MYKKAFGDRGPPGPPGRGETYGQSLTGFKGTVSRYGREIRAKAGRQEGLSLYQQFLPESSRYEQHQISALAQRQVLTVYVLDINNSIKDGTVMETRVVRIRNRDGV